MSRLIDADEIFYDQLLNTGHTEHPLEFAVSKKRIDDMPTIEPPQWIPVTERLPEEDTDVLITEEDGCVDIARYDFNMWSEDPIVEWWNGEYRVYPVAWMPLPAPWKGGAE